MKISTRGRYALRMLVDLAQHSSEGYISLGEIAGRQGISKNYLEQIISMLKNSGILIASRGAQGGYQLSKGPSELKVGELLRCTEGSVSPVACLENSYEDCPRNDFCLTLPVWIGLERVMLEYLDTITIQDILEGTVE